MPFKSIYTYIQSIANFFQSLSKPVQPPTRLDDFEMATEYELWLTEARRQFDLVIKYNKELEEKTRWIFTAFMTVIAAMIAIWEIIGLTDENWVVATLLILSAVGLLFFYKMVKTTSFYVLNVYEELKQIENENENTNIGYQYKRVILGLEHLIIQMKTYNENKEKWHSLTLVYVISMIFLLLISIITFR